MAEGIGCHEIQAESEMFLHLAAEGIGIALVGVLQGHDRRIGVVHLRRIVVRRRVVLSRRPGMYGIKLGHRLDGQVVEEHIVQGLGIEGVHRYFPSAFKGLFEAEVHAEDLRIFEIAVQRIDGGFTARRGDTGLYDIVIRIAGLRERGIQVGLADLDRFGLHTRVVVGIGQPHEGNAAREKTGTAPQQCGVGIVQEPPETDAGREERPRLGHIAHTLTRFIRDGRGFHAFVRNELTRSRVDGTVGKVAVVEARIFRGVVQQHRHIHADTVGQRQVRVRTPLILDIGAQLGGVGNGLPVGRVVGTGNGRIAVAVIELIQTAGEEVCQRIVGVAAVCILQEEVVEGIELIVRTQRHLMRTQGPGHVVRQSDRVGAHGVGTRGVFRSQVDGHVVLDVHVGAMIGHVAMVAYEHARHAQHVLQVRGQF